MFKRKKRSARSQAQVSKPGMELDCYRQLYAVLQTSSVLCTREFKSHIFAEFACIPARVYLQYPRHQENVVEDNID